MAGGHTAVNATFDIQQGIAASPRVAHSLRADNDRSTRRQARCVQKNNGAVEDADICRQTRPRRQRRGPRWGDARHCTCRGRQSSGGRRQPRRRGLSCDWDRMRRRQLRRRRSRGRIGSRTDALAPRSAVTVIAAGVRIEVSALAEAPGRYTATAARALIIAQAGEALVGPTATDLLAADARGTVLAIVPYITALSVKRTTPAGAEAVIAGANRAGVANTAGTIARKAIGPAAVANPLNENTGTRQTVLVRLAGATIVRTSGTNSKLTERALCRTRYPDQEECNQYRLSYSALAHIIPQGF